MCEVDSFMLRLTKIIFFYKIALIFNVAIQKNRREHFQGQ